MRKTMKTKLKLLAVLLLISTINHPLSTAFAQGTAFTYQGRLTVGGNSSTNGSYDFQFQVFDTAPVGTGTSYGSPNPNSLSGVAVSNGLFTVLLNFGSSPFAAGAPRWLDIAVRTNGNGSFSTLNPRQALTATPYAITASNLTGVLPAAQLSGTLSSAQFAGNYVNTVSLLNAGNYYAGNGSGLTGVNAATLGGYGYCALPCYWNLTGNAGTLPGVNFVGTTDNQPLELKVNGQRAMRLEPNASYVAPNFIAGSPGNFISPGIVGAVIGGGGATNYTQSEPAVSGYYVVGSNNVASDFGTIGGGGLNSILGNSSFATVAGGAFNRIQTNARNSTIGGGLYNTIETNAIFATIGGGLFNSAQGLGAFIGGGGYDGIFFFAGNSAAGNASAIVGGLGNQILVGNDYSTIAGGLYNVIGFQSGIFSVNTFGAAIGGGIANTNKGSYATIPGGAYNTAAGSYSLAAGQHAQALHDGAFVWADDSSTTPFSSTAANQFLVRASFVGINRTSPVTGADAFAVRSPAISGYGGMYIDTAGSSGWPFYGYAQGGSAKAWTYLDGSDGNKWKLSYGLTVTPSGSVGIGTSSPDALLSVNGSADKPGGGSWSTFSDGRLKDVGADFDHGLGDLARIQPVHYHYKADNPLMLPSQPEYVGLVAQQVEQAIPEAVQRNKDGYLTVNNDPIIWTMLNAIKELDHKLEAKDVENAELKARLEKLEQLVTGKTGGAK